MSKNGDKVLDGALGGKFCPMHSKYRREGFNRPSKADGDLGVGKIKSLTGKFGSNQSRYQVESICFINWSSLEA